MGVLPCLGAWQDNQEVCASVAIQILLKDPSVEPYVSGGTGGRLGSDA